MNDLTLTGNTLTMSSREIAKLVSSRHGDVYRSIERLISRGAIQGYTPTPYTHEQNQEQYLEYQVGKRDSYVIVAQLSPEFTARLVDRWMELEQQAMAVIPDFSNPAAAARAWAEQFELQQAANQALAIAAPKAEFVDRYVEGTGLKGFRQVCKLLGANENEFRLFLADAHVWYRLGGEWVPYAEHIAAGRFHVKTGQAGNGHNFNAAKFTPKGIEWIAGKWAAYKLQGAA